jgi:hypothetical protein
VGRSDGDRPRRARELHPDPTAGHRLYPRACGQPAPVAVMLWSVCRIKSFHDLLATGADEGRAIVDAMAAGAVG